MSHMVICSCYTLTVISHGVVKKGFCDIVRYISLKELFFFTEIVDPPAALDYSPENIKLIRFPDYFTEQKLPVRQINRQVKITVMKYCLFHYCTIFLTDLVIVRDYIIDESVRKKYPCSQPCMIKQPCVIETSGTYRLSEARKIMQFAYDPCHITIILAKTHSRADPCTVCGNCPCMDLL